MDFPQSAPTSGVSEFPSSRAGLRRLDASRQQALHELNCSRCLFWILCLSAPALFGDDTLLRCWRGLAGPFPHKTAFVVPSPVEIGSAPNPGLIKELVTYVKLGLTRPRMAAFGLKLEFVICQSVPSSRIDTGIEPAHRHEHALPVGAGQYPPHTPRS